MATDLADAILTREQIEAKVEDVLRTYGLKSIPANLIALANHLGIFPKNAEFTEDNIVGMIDKSGDQVTLLVKEETSPSIKRFTLAHELAEPEAPNHMAKQPLS